jgi:GT2 family glycosyltransferase
MAKRKGPLAALIGRSGGKRRFAGWARVDSDNVVRGWAQDPRDLDARAEVEVRVDGEVIGRALADRFDPQVFGAQPGDGRYAFAVLVPARFRDGLTHRFEALVPATDSTLMSKADTFTAAAGAPAPRLAVTRTGPSGASGLLEHVQHAPDMALDLWSGGRRVPDTSTRWTSRGPETGFRIDWPEQTDLDADAFVAAPGMAEAGLAGASLFEGVRLRARPDGDGVLARIQGPYDTPAGAVVRLRQGAGGPVLAETPVARGRARFDVAPAEGQWAELAFGGRPLPGLAGPVDLSGAAEDESFGLPDNLIPNGRLLDWPRGVIVEAGPGRAETAEGWFVQNKAAAAPVRVLASPDVDGDACAIVLTTDSVGDYCRLEARVDPALAEAGRRLTLSFTAGLPRRAPKPFQATRPFVVIDRIFLVQYVRRDRDGREVVAPDVVANVARKVLLEHDPRRFDFTFDVDAEMVAEDGDLFLAFDFKRAFAVSLGDVRLAPAKVQAPAAAGALELEDPAISAQARTLRGLEPWLSPDVVEPGRRFLPGAERPAPAPFRRWSWTAASGGAVEVVVTVHDAPDEALACLQALVAGSGVPHTVRIVDDASGADTRERIAAFIADKPWMRLVSNPENLGYTASANLGVLGSDADWVILLNSDAVVTPGWIEGLLEAAGDDPRVGLVGPLSNAGSYQSVPELKARGGKWKINDLPPGWTPAQLGDFIRERSDKAFPEVPLLNGFCMMIRREAFEQLGGFNEAAFPQGYGEENDLAVRAAAAGWKLIVADHVYVFHTKSASFGAARRLHLQKLAGQALAELHPTIDFTEIGERFREIPALVRIRGEVRELFRTGA